MLFIGSLAYARLPRSTGYLSRQDRQLARGRCTAEVETGGRGLARLDQSLRPLRKAVSVRLAIGV